MKSSKFPSEILVTKTKRLTKNIRIRILALLVLAVLISTAALSPTLAASSIQNFILGGLSETANLFNVTRNNSRAVQPKSSTASSITTESSNNSLLAARQGHTATPIGYGRVLLVGGDGTGTAEIFDLNSGTSTATGNLIMPRTGHTATLLKDGRVLITGGSNKGQALVQTEIYDNGAFLAGPDLSTARAGHTATVLADGRIVIAGGDAKGSIEIMDEAAQGSQRVKARLISARAFHSAELLESGELLIIGGSMKDGAAAKSGEKLNIETMTSSAVNGSLHSARIRPTLRELPDGKVQIIGGNDEGSMEMFTPDGNYFSAYAHVIPGRNAQESRAFKTRDAGTGTYNLATESRASDAESKVMRTETRAALINNGEAADSLLNRSDYSMVRIPETNQVLITGGKNSEGNALNSSMSVPSSPATITTDKLDYSPYETVIMTGTGFQPGETVQLTLVRDPLFPNNPEGIILTSVADENGNFVNTDYVVSEDDLYTSFVLTAVGLTSGITAQTTFTDHPGDKYSIVVSPDNSLSSNYTVTITNLSVGRSSSIGYIKIAAPAGFTPISIAGITASNGKAWQLKSPDGISGQEIVLLPVSSTGGTNQLALDESVSVTINVSSSVNCVAGNTTLHTWTAPKVSSSADEGTGNDFNLIPPTTSINSVSKPTVKIGPICQQPTVLSIAAASGNYGGTTSLTATLTSGLTGVSGKSISFKLNNLSVGSATTNASGVATISDVSLSGISAGAYLSAVTANFAGDQSHSGANGLNALTVNKLNASVTASDASKTYGDTEPALGMTNSGFLANDLGAGKITFSASRVAGESVNTYVITPAANDGTSGLLGNYTVTFNNGTFTIGKKAASVTPAAKSKTYGSDDPALTGATSGFLTADNVVASYSRAAGETVGDYTISASLTPVGVLGNYEITYNTAKLTIGKKSASVSAVNNSKTYGDNDPALATTNIGFLANDLGPNKITFSASRAAGENATTYAITPSSNDNGSGLLNNYEVTSNNATFTINKRNATWTTNSNSKTYGDNDPTPLTTGSGNFLESDGVTATYSRAAGNTVAGGPYQITANLSSTVTGALNNYNITNQGASFSISKKAASISAVDNGKTYGASEPALGTTDSGFLPGDLGAGKITFSASRVAGEGVNTYVITPAANDGTSGLLGNYTVTPNNATFTISKKTASVSAVNNSKTYGASEPTLGTTSSGFLAGDLGPNKITFSASRASGESVNTYVITPAANAGNSGLLNNYDVTYNNATFTINKKAASVTPAAQSKTYGSVDPALTGATSGFLTADNVVASYSRAAGETIGDYTISASLTPVGVLNNYDITYNTAKLTIGKKAASVTPAAQSKTYGSVDPALTGATSGFLTADNVVASYSRAAGETIGDYTISASLTPAGVLGNYDITYNTAKLTIGKKAASVTPAAKSKTYGSADPALTGETSGFLDADNVVASYSRAAGVTIGEYTISATLTPVGVLGNYDITYNTAKLTINQKDLTVTANNKNKTYGETATFEGTEFTTSGLVEGDSVSSVTLTSAGAAATSSAGEHNIVPSAAVGTGLSNYSITYTNGKLNVAGKALEITANNRSKEYGSAMTTGALQTQFTTDGLINGDTVTSVTLSSNGAAAGASVDGYNIVPSAAVGTGLSNYSITYKNGTLNVTKAVLTVTALNNSRNYSAPNPTFGVNYSGFKNNQNLANSGVTGSPSLSTSATASSPAGSTHSITAALGELESDNYSFSFAPGTLSITADPSEITLDTNIDGTNHDCTDNTYTATVLNAQTNLPISGLGLKMKIGPVNGTPQETTATTNQHGKATFTMTLAQNSGVVKQTIELANPSSWDVANTAAPSAVTRDFTVNGNPNVGTDGLDATSLYTGSMYFWTTSSTSSTATLTLSATIKDISANCAGDITKAKVSFEVKPSSGGSWTTVARDLPVGLVSQDNPLVGTASAISQYNIGNDRSATLSVRVVVGGQYTTANNTGIGESLVTISKPGMVNSLSGGGNLLNNDGIPFYANGFLGSHSFNAVFGSQVSYNRSGTNPQGQVTVRIATCNLPNGTREQGCTSANPHRYLIKSNSIAELTNRNGSASFSSKTNVFKLENDGTQTPLDGGGTMQVVFTPQGGTIPSGMFLGTNSTCTNQMGCVGITANRSTGGLWYSSAWGAPSGSTPRTYADKVVNGNVVVQ